MNDSHYRRAQYAIFFSTFVSNAGSYLVIPILSVYLASVGGLSAALIGTIFAVMSCAQTAGSLLAGWAAGRVGTQPVLLAALIIRIGAYPLFLIPGTPAAMAIACAAIWCGSGAYVPTAKAALSAVCDEQIRPRVLALRATVANAGAAVGPLLGWAISQSGSQKALFVGASGAFAISVAASVTFAIPRGTLRTHSSNFVMNLRSVLRLPGAGCLLLTAMAVYSSIPLFELIMPLHGARSVGVMAPQAAFFLNAVVVIFAQAPLANAVAKMNSARCVALGFGLIAMSCLLMLLPESTVVMFGLGAVLYSLGEVLLILRLDISTAQIGRSQWAAAFSALAAVGPLGSAIGSQAYGAMFASLDALAFWIAAMCIALSCAGGAMLSPLLRRMITRRTRRTFSRT